MVGAPSSSLVLVLGVTGYRCARTGVMISGLCVGALVAPTGFAYLCNPAALLVAVVVALPRIGQRSAHNRAARGEC